MKLTPDCAALHPGYEVAAIKEIARHHRPDLDHRQRGGTAKLGDAGIARSVQSVAQGTEEAAANIMQVNRGATEPGRLRKRY